MPQLIHHIELNMDTALNILGLLFSIYALWESKSAKTIAKEVESEIQKNVRNSALSRLNATLDFAIQEIKIFGPAGSDDQLCGINRYQVAGKIQDFVLELNNSLHQFDNSDKKRANHLIGTINPLLSKFCEKDKTPSEFKDIGQEIFQNLSTFSSSFKAALSKRIQRV